MGAKNNGNYDYITDPFIIKAIKQRLCAEELNFQAQTMIDESNAVLMAYMIANEKKNIHHQSGDFVHVKSTTTRFSKEVMKEELVTEGVDARVVAKCFERATTKGEGKEYILFKRNKGGFTN